MDALKSQLLRIQQQLSSLSASQKMLTTALVAIMVMTLFWWGNYAGTAEMEALLDRPFVGDELADMKADLRARGITFKVVGDRILVPADRRVEIIADLGYAQKLPRDMGNAFDEVIDKLNPLQAPGTTNQMLNRGRERALGQIMGRWPGVIKADVMIDNTTVRRIGPGSVVPTATVSLLLKPTDTENPDIATAAASLVVGAQAGLTMDKVNVLINTKLAKLRNTGKNPLGDSSELLQVAQAYEESYRQKILTQLFYIPGVNATVSVELDTKIVTENKHKIDPKVKLEIPKRTTTETEESSQPLSKDGVDPGVVPNTGASIESTATAGAATMNREKSDTESSTDYDRSDSTIYSAPGGAKAVAASLRVPRSYFAAVWKQANKDSKVEPTSAQIEALVEAELPNLRRDVKGATNIADADAISVAPYDDILPAINTDVATASLSVPLAASGINIKEIAIGILAAVSLFMVSMMVRRGTPPPVVLPKPMVRSDRNALRSGDDVAGEAGIGAMVLQGQELTPEALESSQMIEQVSSMVKENPEAAANLVKRWLNQD